MMETSEPEPSSAPAGSLGFADLSLRQEVLQAIQTVGYDAPTTIQSKIIPAIRAGRDVLAQSQTGTGKTAAFALPILSLLDIERRAPQTLVLTPTRELAVQVAKSFSTYAGALPRFRVAAIYGGQDYDIQFRLLKRGAHVIVGTPGRVIDHIKRGTLQLGGINCFVLDEADRMLDMGFHEDVQFILQHMPDERQIALFSATLPTPIVNIAKRYLNEPVRVTIENRSTAELIHQRALFVSPRGKLQLLTQILEVEKTDGVIVFVRTKEATAVVAEELSRQGHSAVALNGDMSQRARDRAVDRFRGGYLDLLVATDVAARGLDVSRVSHVINFDAPQDTEAYIHRVGRTGRAGRTGEAIIFLTKGQRGKLRSIEQVTKKPIEVVQPPTPETINATRVRRFKNRIAEVVAGRDLSGFEALIAEYAEESNTSPLTIAAALARLGQGDRPLLMKGRPTRAVESKKAVERPKEAQPKQPEKTSQKEPERRSASPRKGLARYRIEVGRAIGVKPKNIVSAIVNEAGIDCADIGAIDIFGMYSTIDLPQAMSPEIRDILRKTRVLGKQLRISRATDNRGEGTLKRRTGPKARIKAPHQRRAKGGKPVRVTKKKRKKR